MTDRSTSRLARRRTAKEDSPEPFQTTLAPSQKSALTMALESSDSRVLHPPTPISGPTLFERRRLSSPARGGSKSATEPVPPSSPPSHLPISMNRKRRLSGSSADLMNASPPFEAPLQHSNSSPAMLGLGRRPSLEEQPFHHHNSLLELLHTSHHHAHSATASPRSSPLLVPLHHVASPPPGANFGQSPHALLRQAQLASLAPPELSLPGGAFSPADIDAKWPDAKAMGSPNSIASASSMSPSASPLGTPGSPPLTPLFPPSPGVSVPQHAHYLRDEKLKLTRFGTSYSPTSSESESDASAQGDDSPMSSATALPGSHNEERGRPLRRRRRSHRSARSRGSSSSGEFSIGEEGLLNQSDSDMVPPPSPPHLARLKQPHLAMPERSGWNLTDDDEEGSEEGSDTDVFSDEDEEADDLALTRSTAPIPPAHQKGSPLLVLDIEPELSNLPSLDPRAEQQDARMFEEKAESEAAVLAHDDSLSPLERIFILSKSEYREHRSDISRALPDWLEDVDICEATEYVLPLLSGLAADDDEVKIGLAQGLDRIMFYFYSRCPLADPEEEHPPDDSDSLSGMAQPMEMDEEEPPLAPFKQPLWSSSADPSAPVDPPHVPVGAFTPILGLLLMEQHVEVSSWARASVVRFLCRLHGKPIPSNLLDENEKLETTEKRDPITISHSHTPYDMTPAARDALEKQILVDVVLGLARLDPEEEVLNDSMDSSEDKQGQPVTPPDEPTWGADSQARQVKEMISPDVDSSPDWGMPLRSFVTNASSSSYAGSTPISSGRYFSSSMFDNDNEATQGKIASIELISAIASADCLPTATLVETFVPEIEKMTEDKAFRVRSVAASAIGSLSKSLPPELVETVVLPLSDVFARDAQPLVRRWACLTLPDIFSRMSPKARHVAAVRAVQHFSQDQSRDVRSALTEICGPLIHSFLDEEIPMELLNWYLGRPLHVSHTRSTSNLPERKFNPLATSLSLIHSHARSISDPFTDSPRLQQHSDPERAIISAFNLPAVVLTLGRQRWPEVKQFHASLAQDSQTGVRRSLAASLHAIADIIGAEQAAVDLPHIFEHFLLDTPEIRECVIEHYAAFIKLLPIKHQEMQLVAVHKSLYKADQPSSWRLREQAASQLSMLINSVHLQAESLDQHPIFVLLTQFLKDDMAAVRTAGLSNLTAIWNALSPESLRLAFVNQLLLPLFARDQSYRHRATFVACVAKILKSDHIDRGDFEVLFASHLVALASDPIVDVRLALSRLIGQYTSSSNLHLPPHPLLLQIYRTLKDDRSSMVQEALGSKLEMHILITNGFHPSPPVSRTSSTASYDDEIMSDSILSSSTITDLRSLESNDAFDLLRSDDSREDSMSPGPPSEPFVKQSSFTDGNLWTREHEGFVEVEVE